MPKDIHVVPHDDGWAWRREKSERVSGTSSTQAGAESAARDAARRDHVELFIHGRGGQIRARDSFGNDPSPPRG